MKKYQYTITIKRPFKKPKVKKGTYYSTTKTNAINELCYAFGCNKDQLVVELFGKNKETENEKC